MGEDEDGLKSNFVDFLHVSTTLIVVEHTIKDNTPTIHIILTNALNTVRFSNFKYQKVSDTIGNE